MADNARRTGATFAIADKEELAFVSSLGQLQTSARSAKGSIAEMTKAFQEDRKSTRLNSSHVD